MSFENQLPDEWRNVLPQDMQSSGVLETVKTVEGLAKMAIDGRALASTALRIPSEDATPEARAAFNTDLMSKMPNLIAKPDDGGDAGDMWNKLGRPETVEGYKIDTAPEAIQKNLAGLTAKAHELGLTQAQMNGVAANIIEDYTASLNVAVGKQEEDNNKLKGEWGVAYQPKVDTISHFAEQTGFSEQFLDAIDNGQISTQDMKAFDHIVKGFKGEGINIGHDPADSGNSMTPAEASSRINEIMGNKAHAYWNSSDPAHKGAVDKVLELGQIVEDGREKSSTEKFRASL